MITFIEWSSSTISKGTRLFMKSSQSILLGQSSDGIYWMKLFHDKKAKLTVYERIMVNFIGTELWWNLLNWGSSTKREGTWSFSKSSLLILLERCSDDIYWRGFFHDKRANSTFYQRVSVNFIGRGSDNIYWIIALPRQINELDCLWKTPNRFYWNRVLMGFIEEELIHDNRTNLIVYEKHPVHFICTESWLHSLNGNSFRLENELDRSEKASRSFYWNEVMMAFIEGTLPR
jgi:hypothetical protein